MNGRKETMTSEVFVTRQVCEIGIVSLKTCREEGQLDTSKYLT